MTLVSNVLACDDAEGDLLHVEHPPSNALVTQRTLPPWVKEQIHLWGKRFCLPEWDDDDDVDDEKIVESYRFENEWKVCFGFVQWPCLFFFFHPSFHVTRLLLLNATGEGSLPFKVISS